MEDSSSAAAIQHMISEAIVQIGDFVACEPFQRMLAEMYALPHSLRLSFVTEVVLNRDELRARGIITPSDMVIQRSSFGDGRPTLFCVSKMLPLAYPWHRVTVTFDSAADDVNRAA